MWRMTLHFLWVIDEEVTVIKRKCRSLLSLPLSLLLSSAIAYSCFISILFGRFSDGMKLLSLLSLTLSLVSLFLLLLLLCVMYFSFLLAVVACFYLFYLCFFYYFILSITVVIMCYLRYYLFLLLISLFFITFCCWFFVLLSSLFLFITFISFITVVFTCYLPLLPPFFCYSFHSLLSPFSAFLHNMWDLNQLVAALGELRSDAFLFFFVSLLFFCGREERWWIVGNKLQPRVFLCVYFCIWCVGGCWGGIEHMWLSYLLCKVGLYE